MTRISTILLLTSVFTLAAVTAEAGVSTSLPIKWIKAHSTGVLFALDGFTLADVDPASCLNPGSPYFWIPATAGNYEVDVAILLTAYASDRPVKIRYSGCGNYSPSFPMLDVAIVQVD